MLLDLSDLGMLGRSSVFDDFLRPFLPDRKWDLRGWMLGVGDHRLKHFRLDRFYPHLHF